MLLRRSAGRAVDVKRCHTLRPALQLLDFDDASIEGVQGLLLRAAMLPAFLRLAEGRRFVAYLFTLHVRGERDDNAFMWGWDQVLLLLHQLWHLMLGRPDMWANAWAICMPDRQHTVLAYLSMLHVRVFSCHGMGWQSTLLCSVLHLTAAQHGS